MPRQSGPPPTEELLAHHRDLLTTSCIAPNVIAARGYFSVTRKSEAQKLGFTAEQSNVPALVLPVWSVQGTIALHQLRPDEPRRNREGKPIKYETPRGAHMAIDVPPAVHPYLGDPSKPLFITEGIRKTDALVSAGLYAIGLLGVYNWRGRNDVGGLTALADWEAIALNGRLVYIVFDSDVMTKPQVYGALRRLKTFLEQRGAR
jgi:hypothetical protein